MILTNVRIGIVVTCVLISVAFIVPISQQSRRRNNTISDIERQLNDRVKEIQKWRCSTPKERLVYVGEENSEQITPNFEWFPNVAIVHRCENSSGCCSSHPLTSCRPTETELVSLVFRKINMLTHQHTFERLSFMNHTACSCQSTMTDTNGVTTTNSSSSPSSSSSS